MFETQEKQINASTEHHGVLFSIRFRDVSFRRTIIKNRCKI